MGAKIQDAQHGFINCEAEKLKGCDILLDLPSVGATENVMLASVFAEGETIIRNAAKEPEIIDLQSFLVKMGVNVNGAGTGVIRIEGRNSKLKDVDHYVIPDRIVAGTYMIASAITGGDLTLTNVIPEHVSSVISNLRDAGCRVNLGRDFIHVTGTFRPRAIDIVRTLPYPGFPTDMQAQLVAYMAVSRGTGIMVETVFESRYKHVDELIRMGANIKLEGRIAVVKGVRKLVGANVTAKDLRGGAALVLAGLSADGQTVINGIKHIERGYENIEHKLAGVGANIKRIDG
jgi:UDP-N-acetylglucosamine 1-carboxyvinyltransferase